MRYLYKLKREPGAVIPAHPSTRADYERGVRLSAGQWHSLMEWAHAHDVDLSSTVAYMYAAPEEGGVTLLVISPTGKQYHVDVYDDHHLGSSSTDDPVERFHRIAATWP